MFDSVTMIIGGLLTGLVFGFLLQRAHVTRYQVILGQFLFTNYTVLKVMLTAIVVGAVGVYGMKHLGMIEALHIKSAVFGPVIVGGLIFGVGMAVLGYCPGTGVAAIGEGSRHAIPGVLGMIVGAGVYAEVYPHIEGTFLKWGSYGKITLASVTGASPWLWVGVLAVVAGVVFALITRWERRRPAL